MRWRFAVFLSVFAGLVFYTGWRAAALAPGREQLTRGLSFCFFLFITGWQSFYRSGARSQESLWFKTLAWTATFGMGVWATFLLFSLGVDIGSAVFHLFSSNPAPAWLPAGLMAGAWLVAGLGLRTVMAGPVVREVSVPIKDLPPELEGLRIVQLSDIHVGATIRRDFVSTIVDRVLALKPDLIAITGDLADGDPQTLAEHVRPLSRLSAELGVYYVTGNHEYYWSAPAWIAKAAELGMIPLVNENRVVRRANAAILVGGVTDTSAAHFIPDQASDPRKAAASDQKAALKLLLAHRPDSCFAAEPAGFDLQLSGHTHGGQFFPWSILIPFFHKYYRGLNRHGRMWVYVSTGTGYWGPPHRFLIPSEITLLRLTKLAA